MQARGLDTLILSDPANIFYLTGFDAWAFYAPLFLVVATNEDQPIWIGRFMDAVSARDTTYLRDENIRAYPEWESTMSPSANSARRDLTTRATVPPSMTHRS